MDRKTTYNKFSKWVELQPKAMALNTDNYDKAEARYALLMSQALDKNYIDTTSFDVIPQW